jgi:hypothetical protein
MPQLKKRWQSKLHRRIHRKKSIGNNLQPLNRHSLQIRRPGNRQPGHFHLRQSANLGYSAQNKSKRRQIPSKSRKALAAQRKIQKHLISNNPKRSPRANLVQALNLPHLAKVPGWIIRVNHNHPASPRSNSPLQLMKINLPTMIVNERIPHQLHIRQFRQVIKQRIRRRRNQNLVARIAKQPKNEGVSLASRSSQEKFVNRNAIPPPSEIFRNCTPRDCKPARLGRISKRTRMRKRRKNRSIMRKSTFSRIRNGKIEQSTARIPMPLQSQAQGINSQIPIRPRRKQSKALVATLSCPESVRRITAASHAKFRRRRPLTALNPPRLQPIIHGKPETVRRTRKHDTQNKSRHRPNNYPSILGNRVPVRKKHQHQINREQHPGRQRICENHPANVITRLPKIRESADGALRQHFIRPANKDPPLMTMRAAIMQRIAQSQNKRWPRTRARRSHTTIVAWNQRYPPNSRSTTLNPPPCPADVFSGHQLARVAARPAFLLASRVAIAMPNSIGETRTWLRRKPQKGK